MMFVRENVLIQSLIKGTSERKIQWESVFQPMYTLATNKIDNIENANAYGFQKVVNDELYFFIISNFYNEWVGEAGYPESHSEILLTIHSGSESDIVYQTQNENLFQLFSLAEFNENGLGLLFDTLILEYNS